MRIPSTKDQGTLVLFSRASDRLTCVVIGSSPEKKLIGSRPAPTKQYDMRGIRDWKYGGAVVPVLCSSLEGDFFTTLVRKSGILRFFPMARAVFACAFS